MEAREDKDVFPSASLLREYVSLEGCELHLARLTQRHTGLTLLSNELLHKGLVHLPLLESLKAESGAFTIDLENTPTTKLGALKHSTNLLQQTTHKEESNNLGFLHKETLGEKSLK